MSTKGAERIRYEQIGESWERAAKRLHASLAAERSRAEQAERALQDEKSKLDGFDAYLQDRLNETGRNANPFFADVVVDESCEKLSTWAHAIYAIQDETRRVYRKEAEQAERERDEALARAEEAESGLGKLRDGSHQVAINLNYMAGVYDSAGGPTPTHARWLRDQAEMLTLAEPKGDTR